MGAAVDVRIGSAWLADLVDGYGGVKVTHRADGGPYALSWDQTIPADAPTPALVTATPRVEVTVQAGGARVWGGYVDAAQWTSGEMTASGYCRQAETAIATDGTGATLDVGVAFFAAYTRGAFPFGSLEALPSLSPDTPVDGNYLSALLDAHALRVGKRWQVTPQRALELSADPVGRPSLFVEPGVASLGVSTQRVCTRVFVVYQDRATRATKTVWVGADASLERIADFSMGPSMTLAEAQNLGNRILAKTAATRQFTGSVTIPAGAITNGAGVEVDLAMVRGQQLCQLTGSVDGRNGKSSTDFVIGESVWDVAASTIDLTAVDAVATTFEAVIESLGGESR